MELVSARAVKAMHVARKDEDDQMRLETFEDDKPHYLFIGILPFAAKGIHEPLLQR